nr:MAG TPA: hypothetical protein [Caudoviricetes sp.]
MLQRDYATAWSLFLFEKISHIVNIVCYFYILENLRYILLR